MSKLNTTGFRDWIFQRISAVIIGLYAIFLLVYIICNQPLHFAQWQHLQNHLFVKIVTLLVLLSILVHTWVGLWTVFTDYIKCLSLRLVLQVVIFLLLLAYVIWGIEILWG